MSQLTWENMNPLDTSRYLDAIQKAQAQSVAGVEQIGTAYKGYYDNIKKQNTNDMLTALNQAKNPEELAIAQANIAAMQQRWGSGYDMDSVRTAMDERPTVLNERAMQAIQYQQAKAQNDAMPMVNKAIAGIVNSREGMTPEQQAMVSNLAQAGYDTTGIMNTIGNTIVGDYRDNRAYATGRSDRAEDRKIAADQFEKTYNLDVQKAALTTGQALYKAEQEDPVTVSVAADGTEITTGGGGAANLARFASMSMPAPVRQAVFKGESQGDYDTLYGNSHRAGGRFAGVKLTNMTVNEALEFSKAGGEYARWSKTQKGVEEGTYATPMGAWQVVGTTLRKAVNALGLKGNERMTPELQDKIGDYIYQTQGTKAWKGYRGPEMGGGGYTPGKAPSNTTAGNTPAAAPMVGISREVQQKIRSAYQNDLLKYNENLALKDQPVNVGNVLAGLTAKEKGSTWTQDSFDIVNALKDNPQLKGLSAEGITNVYNRAKAWQAKPGVPIIGYNSAAGLSKSIDQYIKDEITADDERKKHVAKASHPSNKYVQKIQQEFEANGVPISSKEALLHIDPARYESLYGKPTVKVQEAVDKKVDKAAATTPPPAKGKGTPAPAATKTTPTKTSVPTSTTPVQVKNPTPKTPTPTPTKQELVDFYVKRGKVDNVIPGDLFGTPDIKEREKNREMFRQAQKEATERLKAIEVKEKADKEAKKASQIAARDKARIAAAEREKQRIAKERLKLIEEQKAKAKQKSDQQKKLEATFTNASKAGNEEARKRFYTK